MVQQGRVLALQGAGLGSISRTPYRHLSPARSDSYVESGVSEHIWVWLQNNFLNLKVGLGWIIGVGWGFS